MCHECKALMRQIEALKDGNAVLRCQNMTLAVENNNLRNLAGRPMRPVTQDYLTAWEQYKEAGI